MLALAVAATPILAVAGPWLYLRIRFFRRKWTVITLASTPAGEQLLALRALANRPLRKFAAVSMDPVGAWRREDPIASGVWPPSNCAPPASAPPTSTPPAATTPCDFGAFGAVTTTETARYGTG